ncbi:Putative 1-phosphatidylinositol-3-phosphate 5-kinase FAB1D [Apostasia shenzhenica]|uniref:1-phosphatidylinositol-3-phosphate 5-kinase n=1 Tax=Apostasia shenzhenica TaxID=1088818 RepID=A0A2I0ANG8_9ASPA|nr:Putative 1-phosphatidylinositol-3-phosphate 5-kinase FAB1D [Apostasia shenzhenica]
MNSEIRGGTNEALDIHLGQANRGFIKHGEVDVFRSFSWSIGTPTSDITNGFDGIGEATFSGEINRSKSLTQKSYKDSNEERVLRIDNEQDDFRSLSLRTGDDTDGADNGICSSNASVLSFVKTDPLIWRPPEPANIDDDMDSIANNDDDDEDDYSGGTKWVQSTSLGGFEKENGSYKEARQKAMVTAMNGQFKILVSRFLASEGLTSSDEEHGPNWLDIVTSLSWEAALFIKPDAKEGRAMDPGSYVKVKCLATGARSESQIIKGLVFKKNAAHKHMPTKFKNPRLLLVKGVLGQRDLGLSSFNSMHEEKDYLKSVNEMIEACHPNVVLVEKSASRDMQEFLLAKGMTLVFDMKLTRLERIARCIGSQIIPSADILTNRNTKQCDSFHIEKIVEELNNPSETGKRSSRTLMFLEGFSKPLGCTILLKGAHTDELKRVKRVIQYTVFAAYHLILETSFFADQRALFSAIPASSFTNGAVRDRAVSQFTSGAAAGSSFSDIPASNGFLENSAQGGAHLRSNRCLDIDFCEDNFTRGDFSWDKTNKNVMIKARSLTSSDKPIQIMSSFSASLTKLLSDESFTPVSSESVTSFFGFNDKELPSPNLNGVPISAPTKNHVDEVEENGTLIEDKPKFSSLDKKMSESSSTLREPVQSSSAVTLSKVETECMDEKDTVLSPESILVLLSSQHIEKGIVCEQCHLSRIKYYGNFDVSLGRYLQDVLLNQKYSCSSCGEPPESHIYCYTHQNGNLTVLVRQLLSESSLSGAADGKIWMWSRCLKCVHENGIPRSTKRVVMSTAARSLSFGKFLELSFTSHSAASRLSSECGHSLHRDCLRFFGLGSKVAMFRYSPVEIYVACKPSPVLEFANPNGQEWIVQEAKSVLQRGDMFFSEVAKVLHELKLSYSGSFPKQSMKSTAFTKGICEAEEMLIQEKADFEASLLKAINYVGQPEKSMNEILGLSHFKQELFLGVYIWDHRLHHLLQICEDFKRSLGKNGESITKNGYVAPGEINHDNQNHDSLEADAMSSSAEVSGIYGIDEAIWSSFGPSFAEENAQSSSPDISLTVNSEELYGATEESMQEDNSMEPSGQSDNEFDLTMMNEETKCLNGILSFSMVKEQHSGSAIFKDYSIPEFVDSKSLIWIPLPHLWEIYKDLNSGSLQKFEFIRTYTPKYLRPLHELFPQERGSLHYTVGTGNSISVCEDEISSIIACALALSEDKKDGESLEGKGDIKENEKDAVEGQVETDKENNNQYTHLQSEGSVSSSHWSSFGSFDSAGIHPSRSFSSLSDEFSYSVFEGALSVDRLITLEDLHPEIPVGYGKDGSKRLSVICIHAKQFCDLRRICCPSEMTYISSLSRCRKWDAQGGKSKAFFAKSMDDRFIIKQIKKAELVSFLKFAPDYFNHITKSLSTGSQTCLAKILGIYQVRQNKNGKEVKTDLMVMENLLFGHSVTRTYDLKGAVFSRYVADTNDPEKVLLDENFVEDMRLSPIYIGGRTKHLLQRAIWNDTSFLNAINVMDYSLLVGVDKQHRQLVFGIIDYLRQYTWDKQLETWVKSSLVVPKNSLPTIISPKEYKKRFRKFMSRYFLTVPDSWCSAQCSEPCKFCAAGSSSSSSSTEPPQNGI